MFHYKYCIVPECKSTSVKTPDKKFLNVPLNADVRQKWMSAMKRLDWVSAKTKGYCCEDHFDLPTDLDNFIRFNLVGGRMFLKPGVLPHKFDCQVDHIAKPKASKVERKRKEGTSVLLAVGDEVKELCRLPTVPQASEVAAVCLENATTLVSQAEPVAATVKRLRRTKIQCDGCLPAKKIRLVRSRTSPPKQRQGVKRVIDNIEPSISTLSSVQVNQSINNEDKISSCSDLKPDEFPDENEPDSHEDNGPDLYNLFEKKMVENTEEDLGLALNCLCTLDAFVKYSRLPLKNVMLCLRKIKLNEPFSVLKDYFDLSEDASQIFQLTVIKLAALLKKFVRWPEDFAVKSKLPLQFRAKFSNVMAIIDCLEIQIEKPEDSLEQALTWSDYRKSNTLKYMIACTPDGTCCFISKGFGGRTSDSLIMKNCGFLDRLSPGMEIMADRGFKRAESLLCEKGCKLVRLPSSSDDANLTAREEKMAERIASLRNHVERVISRVRNFAFVSPHACVSNELTPLTDYVMVIVCSLINFRPPIR